MLSLKLDRTYRDAYDPAPPVRTEGSGPFWRIVGKFDRQAGRIVNVKVRSWSPR